MASITQDRVQAEPQNFEEKIKRFFSDTLVFSVGFDGKKKEVQCKPAFELNSKGLLISFGIFNVSDQNPRLFWCNQIGQQLTAKLVQAGIIPANISSYAGYTSVQNFPSERYGTKELINFYPSKLITDNNKAL